MHTRGGGRRGPASGASAGGQAAPHCHVSIHPDAVLPVGLPWALRGGAGTRVVPRARGGGGGGRGRSSPGVGA